MALPHTAEGAHHCGPGMSPSERLARPVPADQGRSAFCMDLICRKNGRGVGLVFNTTGISPPDAKGDPSSLQVKASLRPGYPKSCSDGRATYVSLNAQKNVDLDRS